jgi:uncharacterized membrane protein YdbT with pleckstrin-like domain
MTSGRSSGRPLLGAGEQLVFELRAHPYTLAAAALVLIATSGAASYLAAWIPDGPALVPLRLIICGVALVVVGRWVLWPFLTWYATTYVLSTRRLIIRRGVLARHGLDVPLWRVADASVRRSVFQRLFGCGTLAVQTSGERGEIVIRDLPLVEEAQRELYALVNGAIEAPGA